MSWEPTVEEKAELARLWTRDRAEKLFRFEPEGTRWFRLSHKLRLRPRTQVHHLYRWTRWYEDSDDGRVEGTALGRDASPGLRRSPRKMWLQNGWGIAKKDVGRLKSTLPPPQNYILLSNLDDAEILRQPPLLTAKVRLGAFVLGGLSLLGSLASIAALIRDLRC